MQATAEDKQRLGSFMEARRLQLDLLWDQVADMAGLSAQGLRDVRDGVSTPRSRTKRRIEKALQWTTGSIDLILAGGEPVEEDPTPAPALPWPPARPSMPPEGTGVLYLPNWFKSELDRRGVAAQAVLEVIDLMRAMAEHNQSTVAELLLESGLVPLSELNIRDRPDPIREAIERYVRDVQRITASPRLSKKKKDEIRTEAADELLKILEKATERT